MSMGEVRHIDTATHKVVDTLLPWFVNGTLESEERALVQRHLGQCERCRREADWLQELQAACAAAAVGDASPALQRLREQLLAPRIRPGIKGRLRNAWQSLQPWPRAVIAAQLAAIVILGAVLIASDESRAPYRTLGTSAAGARAAAALVVVFDPATTELDMRRALRAAGARIVDGPTQTNAYLLDVPPGTREQAIRALKGERRVVMVESLGAAR